MRSYLVGLLLVFSSCMESDPDPETIAAQTEEKMAKIAASEQEQLKKATDYITKNLSGWSPTQKSDYAKLWWSFYDPSSVTNYVVTDINDDGKPDYGFILKNAHSLRVAILINNGNSFTHWIADNFNKSFNAGGKDLQHGLSVEVPGKIDVVYPKDQSLMLKSNAINLLYLENRVVVYHWQDGKMASFQTGAIE